jgi:hypothetical protein
MAYIDNPYANSLRQAQAMPAVQQALGGYEGGMDGLMRLFQQQYSRPQQQTNIYNPQVETQQPKRYNPQVEIAQHPEVEAQREAQRLAQSSIIHKEIQDMTPEEISASTAQNEYIMNMRNQNEMRSNGQFQISPQFGGLGSMNSGGMGYGNMFRMQNERMPQYGGYGGYGGGMRPQPYQQMPQPQYQPYASPYQQQYPQPQRYGGYGRQQQYGGYGGGYGGMQNQYQPQQYGGGGQQYGQQYGGGGYGQQYGGGYGNQNNYQSYGGQNQDKPPYPPMY